MPLSKCVTITPQVIIGSERSRIRATLPFYFTRQFLDAPLTQRQRTASEQWRSGGGGAGTAGGDGRIAAVGDVEAGLGTQHGSAASIASTDGGDVPLQGTRLQQGDCQGLNVAATPMRRSKQLTPVNSLSRTAHRAPLALAPLPHHSRATAALLSVTARC